MKEDVLRELWEIIESRRVADPDDSWTAKLLDKGTAKIAKKVGEEATEVIIASLTERKKDLVAESADLIYHLFVLLASRHVPPDKVYDELARRFAISGIEEKQSRKEW